MYDMLWNKQYSMCLVACGIVTMCLEYFPFNSHKQTNMTRRWSQISLLTFTYGKAHLFLPTDLFLTQFLQNVTFAFWEQEVSKQTSVTKIHKFYSY